MMHRNLRCGGARPVIRHQLRETAYEILPRRGDRVVRWIGAAARRTGKPRAQETPHRHASNVVALSWSQTFGRGPSLRAVDDERLGIVLSMPDRRMGLSPAPRDRGGETPAGLFGCRDPLRHRNLH